MIFCLVLLCAFLANPDVTLDQLKALAKIYLRDSAEVPMSVDVTTAVTNPAGRVTHRGHLTATMVFRGYSLQTGKFTVRASKDGLTPFGLRDSLSGDMAAFFGGSTLFRKEDPSIEIRQAPEPGKPVVAIMRDAKCLALELHPNILFPQHPCGSTEIAFISGPAGDLTVHHVTFDSAGAPAIAKVPHMGTVELKAFHYEVEFQLKTLPGEAKPYLWPLETIVAATTDKGVITITNRYTAKR